MKDTCPTCGFTHNVFSCKECQKTFRAKGHQSYCSDECRQVANDRRIKQYRWKEPKEPRICKHCHKSFTYINPRKIFCCQKCAYTSWYQNSKSPDGEHSSLTT